MTEIFPDLMKFPHQYRMLPSALLRGQKFGVYHSGILYLSPAIYSLMDDEDNARAVGSGLPVVISDTADMFEVYREFYNKNGMEIFPREVIHHRVDFVYSGRVYEARLVQIIEEEKSIDIFDIQVKTCDRRNEWMSVRNEIISQDLKNQVYRFMAYDLAHNLIYGDDKVY